ncbi:hypothetical protein DCCM_2534 [Desulfocucumis palustris]|uniref:Methyltransferase domain-containing protein n=1 Tax=Desulfocucumis palustris TaxID=1898651 RepID=A0A2L2XCK4_9FIRM|nr:class I SAM-dependent methyltransferase [Desulfocucumis palustris]GBF33433.1 hypothetical protein DCCM_2534 [Desulfocucumis palustris]
MNGGDIANRLDKEWLVLSPAEIAAMLGVTGEELMEYCGKLYPGMDLRYKAIGSEGRDGVILDVLKRLESGAFTASGRERLPHWEKGWGESLGKFEEELDDKALIPAYVRPGGILRINGGYARGADSFLELSFYTLLRTTLFSKYFSGVESVYEFGCGTGYNLVMLARMYPEKNLFGLDWASTSVKLVDRIAAHYKFRLAGFRFDMYNPDYNLSMPPGSAVLTLNSMEQLGGKWESFLNFLLLKKPALCVHAEPFAELYNQDSLIDYLALKYHRARGYLNGFLTKLVELERAGRIEILTVNRVPFGSCFHEGYSIAAWRPLPGAGEPGNT